MSYFFVILYSKNKKNSPKEDITQVLKSAKQAQGRPKREQVRQYSLWPTAYTNGKSCTTETAMNTTQ